MIANAIIYEGSFVEAAEVTNSILGLRIGHQTGETDSIQYHAYASIIPNRD